MPKPTQAGRFRGELSPRALECWNPALQAAVEHQDNSLTLYGVIGEDWYGEGISLAGVDAALRAIGDKPITVYINSPGGDMFEGLAIYNRLRAHRQPVTTKVLGLAASAASLIAMAGSERQVATSGFLMIHNCWTWLAANRHGLRTAADDMQEFDSAMAELYAQTSGQSVESLAQMMDEETFIRGQRALELGLATALLNADEAIERETPQSAQANALKRVDLALAQQGLTHSARRQLLAQINTSTPKPTPSAPPSAVAPDLSASLSEAQNILSLIGGRHA